MGGGGGRMCACVCVSFSMYIALCLDTFRNEKANGRQGEGRPSLAKKRVRFYIAHLLYGFVCLRIYLYRLYIESRNDPPFLFAGP